MTKKRVKTKKNNKKKKSGKKLNTIVAVIAILILAGIVASLLFMKGQKLSNRETVTLYIPSGSTYEAVVDSLTVNNCIGSQTLFNIMARLRHYKDNVKGGCYILKPEMNLWNTLTKLYYGNQDPIHVTIGKYRTKKQMCDYLGKRLEFNGDTLLALLEDDSVCASYGYTPKTIIAMFARNTYDIYWNTSTGKFLDRMHRENEKFWDKRLSKCKAMKLTPVEVTTLASIVDEETNKDDEKELIASVYLNRLRKNMLLQADPTLKYAVGDFTLKRILNKHMETESPYNTYKYRGLPPGPICIPGTSSIDAVLADRQSDYLYFCAKADFSGRHAFATNLAQHNANAQAFHDALNRRKIY